MDCSESSGRITENGIRRPAAIHPYDIMPALRRRGVAWKGSLVTWEAIEPAKVSGVWVLSSTGSRCFERGLLVGWLVW